MGIYTVINQENKLKSDVSKLSKKALTVCLLACTLMFLLQRYPAVLFPAAEDEITYILQSILLYLIYICIPFGIAQLYFKRNFKNDGYVPVKRILPKKPLMYIAGTIGIGYAVSLTINLLFEKFVEEFGIDTVFVPESIPAIILYYVQIAVIPAILEEWAFRGVILKNLLPYGKGGAILISSLMFGIAHLDLPRIIFATVFAILLSICYEYTNSLFVPIVIHFLNNSLSATAIIYANNDIALILMSLVIFIFIGVGIGALVYYSSKGIKHKRASLVKPDNIGYKVPVGKYIKNFIFNVGIIPYMLVFAYFLYLIYYA